MLIIDNVGIFLEHIENNPQTLLEECKYEIKKNKMENFSNDYLDPRSSDESGDEFDNEFDNESDNDESND